MNIVIALIVFTGLILLWIVGFLFNKYLIMPFFLIPKFYLKELLDFLEENDCVYITHRSLTKEEVFKETKEMGFFGRLYSFHSDYAVIGYSSKDNLYKKYRMRITNNLFFFMNRTLRFTIDKDKKVNRKLQEEYADRISIVGTTCPACRAEIKSDETCCPNCGLTILK